MIYQGNKKTFTLLFLILIFFLNAKSQTVKILFDASKAESAGNADWVIDASANNLGWTTGPAVLNGGNESNASQIPLPAQSGITGSTSELFWDGALSFWGIDCVNRNYLVESLPYNGQITYGNSGNAQDLSNYNVFIVCEPNILFTASEKTAMINFVLNGGGLFMISDHDNSDRNNDGEDSPMIWNDFITNNSVQNNPFGINFDLVDFSQTTSNIPNLPGDSILNGPAGSVTSVQWNNGTSLTLTPGQNSTVKGVVYKTGSGFGSTNVMCAYARYGNGKVAAFGDSSPCDDGSGDSNDGLFDGYVADAGGNHRKLLMNITIWLATPNSSPPPVAPVADFNANNLVICTGQSTTFTNASTGSITSYSWNFGSGASPATANSAGPHNVTYSTNGQKTVSLTVTGPGGSSTETKTDYLAAGNDRIKIMCENLLNYPSSNADTTNRNPYFRTIISSVEPDILVVEEMTSSAGMNGFLSNVLNASSNTYSQGTFINGFDTDNGIFYKTNKFTFVSNTPIETALRDISEFKLVHVLTGDTVRIYAVHLKASSGVTEEALRAAEVDSLRKVTNALPVGSNFIVCGDFNIYKSGESAYQKLLLDSPAASDGNFIDPLPLSGTWNNPAFSIYHTQSPRDTALGDGGAIGGLDDRFDMMLFSNAINQPGGMTYVAGSTVAYGNDGNHYNKSVIEAPTNTAVSATIANALYRAADHLPVYALFDFQLNNCLAADVGALALLNPITPSCPSSTQSLQVRVKNYGSNAIDFSTSPMDVVIQITNPSAAVQSFTKTILIGTLAAGGTMDVTFNGTYNMSTLGNYTFNANTVLPADINSTNNAIAPAIIAVNQSFAITNTVVSEDMGTVGGTTSIASHETANGFQNDNLTMSGTGDVRNTQVSTGYTGASGAANVFITAATPSRYFTISDINTSAFSNLQLSFAFYKASTTSTGNDSLIVQISSDGTNYTPLSFPPQTTGAGTAKWYYVTASGMIPSVPNLRIQFKNIGLNATTTQYRIDDVLLVSTTTAPEITAQGPVTFCNGGSVALNASAATSYLWSNGLTTQNISVNTTGNYFVTATNANGCTASSSVIAVTVNPKYNINTNVSICPGSSYTLPGGQVVNTAGNYPVTLQTLAGCDSIINTNLSIIVVTDNNVCTTDACDLITGNVTHTQINTDDNNVCTTDGCNTSTGVFHNAVNTNDNNVCTTDGCDPVTGEFHNSVNTNDNNVCTTDGCDPVSGVFHNSINTNDNNACTIDGCDPITGVFHNSINTNDNNVCTTDGCDPLTGVFHNSINTNDNNVCTTDGCDPLTGVFHNSINTNDNNVCTTDECDPLTGVFHNPVITDDNNICTTDGCDPVTGIYHNPTIEICGNGIDDNCDGFTDENCGGSLTVKIFIEGFYLGGNMMHAVVDSVNHPLLCDTVTLKLYNAISPYALFYSGKVSLSTNGQIISPMPPGTTGNSYYIVITHRNALETWTHDPVMFNSSNITYDFTTAAVKAYGNKQIQLVDGNFAFYSGDVDHNGQINSIDQSLIESAAQVFTTGYTDSDLTGDGATESVDFSVVENNLLVNLSRP